MPSDPSPVTFDQLLKNLDKGHFKSDPLPAHEIPPVVSYQTLENKPLPSDNFKVSFEVIGITLAVLVIFTFIILYFYRHSVARKCLLVFYRWIEAEHPNYIKVTVLKMLRTLMKARDWLQRRREAKRLKAENEEQLRQQREREAWERSPEGIRAGQLAALHAAVPSHPPERMRATIHVNPVSVSTTLEKQGTYPTAYETIQLTNYSVDMVLEFSERDRALLLENQLEQLSFEDRSTRLMSEAFNTFYSDEQWRAGIRGNSQLKMIEREMFDQNRKTWDQIKSERTKITIADYGNAEKAWAGAGIR